MCEKLCEKLCPSQPRMAKVGDPNCLQIVVGQCPGEQCPPNWISPLRIEEHTVANDQRILAHVSGEEARSYVRGVNAQIAESRRWYKPYLACFLLGAALFGTLMGVFHEEPRIRCKGRVCERGEDPLVDGCCMFWCCGQEMKADKVRGRRLKGRRGGGGSKGGKKKDNVEDSRGHKLKTRPYDRWDVWANETYFDDTERCTPYDDDYTIEKDEKLDKRDAAWACDTCPAFLLGRGLKCRTMVEGKARRHETSWPLFLLIPFLLPLVLYFTVACTTLTCQAQRLYKKAFEEWRARGVITHVEFQRGGKHSPHYLRLWFPPGQAVQTANPEGPVFSVQDEEWGSSKVLQTLDLDKLTNPALRSHLRARDLETGGTKRAMVKRLQADLEAEPRAEATGAPPPLHEIVDALKRNLGLEGTFAEVVDAACLQLGVAPTGNLQEKGAACWRAMEG